VAVSGYHDAIEVAYEDGVRLEAENVALRARVAELVEQHNRSRSAMDATLFGAASEVGTLRARVAELEGLLREAGGYVTHNDECELGRTPGVDTCTCGYFDMRDRARAALTPKGGET
jgi:hypothetical protein